MRTKKDNKNKSDILRENSLKDEQAIYYSDASQESLPSLKIEKAIPHYVGHRNRLRKRFMSGGAKSLLDYELLELLLFYSIPRKDVKKIAKELLDRFDTLSGVFSASPSELSKIKGVSESTAILVSLVRELMICISEDKALRGDVLSSPELVAKFARAKIGHLKQEVLLSIFLNAKNRICGYETISEGTTDCAVVYPRKIVKLALEKNACGIIISHNHPSGECEPSSDDISLTRKVQEAAKAVDLKVLDHVIVGKSGYYSFVEKGIVF